MISNLIKNKTISIIGAGPVGLTIARLLQMRGGNVTIYERDHSGEARISGGTLDIHHDIGQIALKEAGVLEAYFANARAVGERHYDMDGKMLGENIPTEDSKFLRPEIDRTDLRKIFLDALKPGTILWDKHFTGIEKKGDNYQLSFKDGSTALADIVIAADGGRSKIRHLVTDALRVYTGTTIIQGDIQDPETLCPDMLQMVNKGNMAALGEQKLIFIQCRRDGSWNYYLSFRRPENWFANTNLNLDDLTGMCRFLASEFQNWHPNYHQLFKATGEFQLLPMYRLTVETPWTNFANIALVGDAAHVMPPFAGVGVNIGLLDALNLADNLTSGDFDSVSAAIKDYAEKMFKYAAKAQSDTTHAELEFHSDNTLVHFGES